MFLVEQKGSPMKRISWQLGALLALGTQACGSGGSAPRDDPGGGQEQATPILARTQAPSYTCSTEGVVDYSAAWSYGTGALAAQSEGALVARVEGTASEFGFPEAPYRFVVSAVHADGALDEAHEIAGSDGEKVSDVALLALPGGRAAMVWVEGEQLRFTAMTRDFATSPPATLPSGMVTRGAAPALAQLGAEHVAVAYRDAQNHARYLVVDLAGKAVVSALSLGKGEVDAPPQVVADEAGGSAVLWSAWLQGFDENNQRPSSEVFFVRVDAAGKLDGEPRQLSHLGDSGTLGDASFASSRVALIARPGGFLTAWSEGGNGGIDELGEGSGGFTIVRVLKLDADGKAEGAPVQLSEREDSIDDVEPGFVALGDAIALLWARGSHIYVCGGCVPDHDIQAVLIDPDTLDPLSAPVKAGVAQGGLLHRHSASQGGTILNLSEITFHTSSKPAFAAFSCQPK